jgi:hypothetical protein
MINARRRRTVAISVLAPLSAYALSAAVDWAIGHSPVPADAAADVAKPARDPRVAQLRADIRRATSEYKADRHRLLRLQREVGHRAKQVSAQRAANAARIAAAQAAAVAAGSSSSGGTSYVPPPAGTSSSTSGGLTPAAGPAPAPPPPPPPPPPPTQSTTGASG